MKMTLAEKPSMGIAIAKALNIYGNNDGYIENDKYIVTWCIGHLAGLADAAVYDEKYAKWSYEDLPILPDKWQLAVNIGKEKQFNTVKELMLRDDVTEIINACDAGREGELIFRFVYAMSGCDKPFKRLWISSLENSAIREGFNNLRDGNDYDDLYRSAICRAKADWLVGINATRLYSTLYHKKLNIGRVQTPTLALIVERESKISAFKKEKFYTVELCNGTFKAVSDRFPDKSAADKLQLLCNNSKAVCTSVKRDGKAERSVPLFDLTTLQREANRLFGFTAKQTLDYAQSLYEKKLITYPRTDSRYLTDDMRDTATAVIHLSAKHPPFSDCGDFYPDCFYLFNNDKVTDHHAIIPTKQINGIRLNELPKGERYILQHIAEGQEITVSASVNEGYTSPPKQDTEDTLLSAMETAGAKETTDEAERKGLGTPATRAGIIEKLVQTGFIERKGKSLIPTRDGISLASIMPEMLSSPLLTAKWENRLAEIAQGKYPDKEFMTGIEKLVSELVKTYHFISDDKKNLFRAPREVIGKCPRCGSDVYESKANFCCANKECRFVMWKNDGMLSTYKMSEQSRRLLWDNKIKIEENTVTCNGEPLYKINRRYSSRKTKGCYRELTPTLEKIDVRQQKPSIRKQLAENKSSIEPKKTITKKKEEISL